MKTLGPLVELAPGETANHTERWHLFEDVSEPEDGADASSISPE